MANFLEVNGFAVSVADGGFMQADLEIASAPGRSPGLVYQDNRRTLKRQFSVTTTLMAPADAEALENWLLGIGFHVGFNTGYASEHGLHPDAGYTGILTTALSKFGTRSWKGVNSTDGVGYRYPVRTRSNDWTACGWHYQSAWQHWAIVSKQGSVTKYLAGAVTAASLGFHTNSTPTSNAIKSALASASTAGVAAANVYFDDLCFFPWALTAGQVAALAARTAAMSPLPSVYVSGECIREAGPITMRASIESQSAVNVDTDTDRTVSFKLEEV